MSPDEALVEQARAGDLAALEALVERYTPVVTRVAGRVVGPRDDPRDDEPEGQQHDGAAEARKDVADAGGRLRRPVAARARVPEPVAPARLGRLGPRVIANAATGEQVTFVTETPDLLVMEALWTRPGKRTAAHLHPRMEERWTVLGPGESVVAPAGVPQVAWNPGPGEARVRIEMRPALRWRAFVERLFAGEDARTLLAEFADEVVPA